MKLKLEDFGPSWQVQMSRFQALRRLGVIPRTILDIGAYHGDWTQLVLNIWPEAKGGILMIEPNEDCQPFLEEIGIPYKMELLSDKFEEISYYKSQNGCGEGNSVFLESSEIAFQPVKKMAKTLQQVVGDATIDFIKMDCQGSEHKIVSGSKEIFARTGLVQLECQIQQYNQGAPMITDIIELMYSLNFRLYDMVDFHYDSRSMLIQADLLFAKKDAPIFPTKF